MRCLVLPHKLRYPPCGKFWSKHFVKPFRCRSGRVRGTRWNCCDTRSSMRNAVISGTGPISRWLGRHGDSSQTFAACGRAGHHEPQQEDRSLPHPRSRTPQQECGNKDAYQLGLDTWRRAGDCSRLRIPNEVSTNSGKVQSPKMATWRSLQLSALISSDLSTRVLLFSGEKSQKQCCYHH